MKHSVEIHISWVPTEEQRAELHRELNRLYGFVSGEVKYDASRTPEHREAAHRIAMARVALDVTVFVNADGTLDIEAPGPLVVATLKRYATHHEKQCNPAIASRVQECLAVLPPEWSSAVRRK